MPLRLFALLFVLLLASPGMAKAALPELHRGLNLSSWLANAPRQPLLPRDFAQIKAAGFDHVRLPWNPEYYGFKLTEDAIGAGQLDFTPLDRAIAMAEQAGLPLILDVHPSDKFVETLQRYPWAEQVFTEFWKEVAEHYRSHPSNALIFELLNEPQYYKAEGRWNRLSARLIQTIKAISPDRVIIVGAPHGSDIDGLQFLDVIKDPLVIYAFHFYEPYAITHQGIHMGFEGKAIRYFRNLPYPSNLATKPISSYVIDPPDLAEAQNEFTQYYNMPWNADHIDERIKAAHDWAIWNDTNVICGEYGVLRNHIDPDSRYRWIHDARKAMENYGIAWELWDYADLFGIAVPVGATSTDPIDGSVRLIDENKGSRQFEPAALSALGLAP